MFNAIQIFLLKFYTSSLTTQNFATQILLCSFNNFAAFLYQNWAYFQVVKAKKNRKKKGKKSAETSAAIKTTTNLSYLQMLNQVIDAKSGFFSPGNYNFL